MSSVPEQPVRLTGHDFLRIPPFEDLSDEARGDLLACYELLLDIGRRKGLLGDEADAEDER